MTISPPQGYTFEGAEASMALMIFRTFDTYKCPFALVDYTIVVADSHVEGNSDHMLGEFEPVSL